MYLQQKPSKIRIVRIIVFICDHAKSKIPLKYNNLGLTKKEIESHIAYDIGTEKFGIELTKNLKQTYIMSTFQD